MFYELNPILINIRDMLKMEDGNSIGSRVSYTLKYEIKNLRLDRVLDAFDRASRYVIKLARCLPL